jgi:hypothetical protein
MREFLYRAAWALMVGAAFGTIVGLFILFS